MYPTYFCSLKHFFVVWVLRYRLYMHRHGINYVNTFFFFFFEGFYDIIMHRHGINCIARFAAPTKRFLSPLLGEVPRHSRSGEKGGTSLTLALVWVRAQPRDSCAVSSSGNACHELCLWVFALLYVVLFSLCCTIHAYYGSCCGVYSSCFIALYLV